MRKIKIGVWVWALVGVVAASAGGAFADPGPGFGISHYKVDASAHAFTLGGSGINTTPSSSVSVLTYVSPFNYAEGDASNLFVHGNALACCGGAGEAGGGGDSEILYSLTGGSPGQVYDITFSFLESLAIGAVPPGTQTIVNDYQFIISSNLQSVILSPSGQVTIDGSGAASLSASGFGSYNFSETPDGGWALSGQTSATIEASQYVLIDLELSLQDSTSGGPVHADATASFAGAFVPRNVVGPLPVLTTPGVPSIPIKLDVPEPSTWAMMLFGVGGLGATLRRRRVTRSMA